MASLNIKYPAARGHLLLSSLFFWLVVAFCALRVVMTAWVTDDAFITLRVLDNFLSGYGLRWNVDERVQAYTHPLWLMLQVPLGLIHPNHYLNVLLLSFACTAAALWLLFLALGQNREQAALWLAIPFSLSKPLVEFSTSGLENSLSFLLVAGYIHSLLRLEKNLKKYGFILGLISSLLVLNRLDLAIIIIPSSLWALSVYRRAWPWRRYLLSGLPIILWLIFSLIYYGSFFPNTKYAKLHSGVEDSALWFQGMLYFFDLVTMDAFSAAILLSLVPLVVIHFRCRVLGPHHSKLMLLALGAIAYCLYVVMVGGDFMSGRFWTVPLFISLYLIANGMPALDGRRQLVAAALMALVSYASFLIRDDTYPRCPPLDASCIYNNVYDDRAFYSPYGNLFPPGGFAAHSMDNHPWRDAGLALRSNRINAQYAVGIRGYYAGPGVYIIDHFALGDPLLSRLPIRPGQPWYAGHYLRDIPAGYEYALLTGSSEKMDKDLAAYYDNLRLVIRAPVWSKERLVALVQLQTGAYDHYLHRYQARLLAR